MNTVSHTHSGVRASAGSGKTYELTGYYLRSLFSGASPRELLAATFTRKAAGEILGRVLLRFCDACEDPVSFANFVDDLGIQKTSLEQGRELLQQLCRELHHVKVSTIDSFFGQMLRSYSHDLGVSPDLKMVEAGAPEVERAHNEAIRQLLSAEERTKVLALLESLEPGKAGRQVSGSLSARFTEAYQHFAIAPPAAWTPKYSVRPQLSEAELEQTLEALENWVPREEVAKKLPETAKKNAQELRNRQWTSFLGGAIAKSGFLGEFSYYSKKLPADLAELYQPLVTHASSILLEEHRSKTVALAQALRLYHERYSSLREREGFLLFHDVPLYLARFMADLTPKEIAHRLDSRIDYLLLDEFQDTAPQQYAILKPFMQHITSLPPERGLLFCVGDLKQSIYGWRGATPEIFAQLANEFPQMDWRDSDQSYRSSPVVLSMVNQLFSNLETNAAIPKEWNSSTREWTGYFGTHHAMRSELSGYIELLESPRHERSSSTENKDEDPQEKEELAGEDGAVPSPVSHLEFAAKQIAKLASEAPHVDIGVLTRRNETATELIYLLRKEGVAATSEAGHALSEDPAVRIILSALHFAEHPDDQIALFQLYNSPLAQSLRLRGEAAVKPALAAQHIRCLWHEIGFAPTLIGWAKVLAESCERKSALCLEQLIQLAEQYSLGSIESGEEFASLVRSQSAVSAARAQVRVMTIHKSKGLEFDAVFLPELGSAILRCADLLVSHDPKTWEIRSVCLWPNKILQQIEPSLHEACQEHNRLLIREAFCALYVAITRAKRAVYLVVPPNKINQNGKAGKPPFTPASIVRAGLCGEASLTETEAKTELYTSGDPLWYQDASLKKVSPPAAPAPSTFEEKKPVQSFDAKVCDYNPRNWQRVSPSLFEDGVERTVADLLEQDESAAAARGQVIHELFSRLEWLGTDAEQEPSSANLVNVKKRIAQRLTGSFSEGELQNWFQSFETMLQNPGNRRWLQYPPLEAGEEEVEVEVWRERRFAVYTDRELVVGQFDRVLVFYANQQAVRAEIIDFKTGTAQPTKAKIYAPQMELYRKALQKQLALSREKIRCYLLFVEEGTAYEI